MLRNLNHVVRKTALIVLFGALNSAKALTEASQLEEWCEKQWIANSAAYTSQDGKPKGNLLLTYWLTLEPRCGATFAYSGRLALVHVLMKDFNAAKSVLAKAPPTGGSPYAYSVDIAKVMLQVEERIAAAKPVTGQDIAQFEKSYANLVAKYPKWPTGYALLAGVQTLLGKHHEAIRNLKVAAKGDAYELFGVYRNLTISYAAIGDFMSAADSADKAYRLNPGLTSDSAYMFAAATAASGTGHFDDAET